MAWRILIDIGSTAFGESPRQLVLATARSLSTHSENSPSDGSKDSETTVDASQVGLIAAELRIMKNRGLRRGEGMPTLDAVGVDRYCALRGMPEQPILAGWPRFWRSAAFGRAASTDLPDKMNFPRLILFDSIPHGQNVTRTTRRVQPNGTVSIGEAGKMAFFFKETSWHALSISPNPPEIETGSLILCDHGFPR
jgi:hypothetical protein